MRCWTVAPGVGSARLSGGCSGCSLSIGFTTAYGWAWWRLWRGSAPSSRAFCSPMMRRAQVWRLAVVVGAPG
eukprot:13751829-Alexandrium_andersonii.AAC.1